MVGELANVLHPLTYSEEGVPVLERYEMMQVRKLGRHTLSWFFSRFEIKKEDEASTIEEVTGERFVELCLVHQIEALKRAKEVGPKKERCDAKDVAKQLELYNPELKAVRAQYIADTAGKPRYFTTTFKGHKVVCKTEQGEVEEHMFVLLNHRWFTNCY